MGRYLNFLGLVFCLVLSQTSAALATDYEFTTIDFPGAPFSEVLGINNVGDVVEAYGSAAAEHGLLLSRGTFSTIDVPGAVVTNAAGINNRGEIVGEYKDGGGHYHGYLLSDGRLTIIDFPGASDTFARGINAAGQVVGQYVAADGSHGFLFSRGTFTTIDVPGFTGVVAYGINAAGQIVGSALTGVVPSAFVRNQDGTVTTIALPGPIQPMASLSTAKATSWECTKSWPVVPATPLYSRRVALKPLTSPVPRSARRTASTARGGSWDTSRPLKAYATDLSRHLSSLDYRYKGVLSALTLLITDHAQDARTLRG